MNECRVLNVALVSFDSRRRWSECRVGCRGAYWNGCMGHGVFPKSSRLGWCHYLPRRVSGFSSSATLRCQFTANANSRLLVGWFGPRRYPWPVPRMRSIGSCGFPFLTRSWAWALSFKVCSVRRLVALRRSLVAKRNSFSVKHWSRALRHSYSCPYWCAALMKAPFRWVMLSGPAVSAGLFLLP